jgi:hypothetical protein
MSYSFQLTGNQKTDQVVGEIAGVLNWLKRELDKKADKRLLDSLIQALEAGGDLPALKYWRRIEVGHVLHWQYDSNFGVGAPNWVTYESSDPEH